MKTPAIRHVSRLLVLLLAMTALVACTAPSGGGAGATPGAADPSTPASGEPAPGGDYEYGD